MNPGNSHDVLVAGLGAMGSAALFHLARRGLDVLGLDQYAPPHSQGSSHGDTRVIREAYFEHPVYVPLVQRAYVLWEQLERLSGERLYLKTGGIMIGRPGSAIITGAVRSASEHGLNHEILTSARIRERFPGFHPLEEMVGVLEPRAGILYPEKCIAAHLSAAARHGAKIHTTEKVISWKPDGSGLLVQSNRQTYRAGKLIVSVGPWIRELLNWSWFQIERQVLLWFKAKDPALFRPDCFPIHLWEYDSDKFFYGFPDLGSGTKVAFHHQGELVTPATVDRNVRTTDVAAMRELLERFLPAANGGFLRGVVCLYTNSPDGHFVIDFHPEAPNVIIASPCSGHGFKFSSAIGELLADLAAGIRPAVNLSPFSLARFPRSASV